MPIRTNRGRAAVYRRLWGWPLRSPKHLIGTFVVCAVLVTGVGIAIPKALGGHENRQPQDTNSGAAATSSKAPNAPAAPTTSLPTRLTSPQLSPTPAPPAPEALSTAKEWATAWANHPEGVTNQQWLEGLRPHTTQEYLPVMSSVDPANIPATKVTGEPSAAASFTSSVDVLVPTDGPRLTITVVKTNAGWRVSRYDQAR